MAIKWRTFNQIKGYKGTLSRSIKLSRDGAYAKIDIKTANALIEILDQAMHTEYNHEQHSFEQ